MKNIFKFFILLLYVLSIILGNSSNLSADSSEQELFLVAQKAFEDGFYDVAIRYINQYLEEYSETDKHIQVQLLLGQCYFFKNQYLKAYNIFHNLMAFSEYKDATLFWLGETYFKGADYEEATKYYHQLLEIYPQSHYYPQAIYSLGWTFYEQKKYNNAKEAFLRLIKNFPTHQLSEEAGFKIGECEHNLGSYEKSNQYFQRYVRKYPQSPKLAKVYFYIAEGYYYLENCLTAITYYAKADDKSFDLHLNYMANVSMGWCYLKLEKYELSKKYFDKATQISKDNNDFLSDDIFLGQASLYLNLEQHAQALKAYKKLIENFPQSERLCDALLGMANIFYVTKDYPQAINGYKSIIQKFGENIDKQKIVEKAYYGLAWTYLKSGEPDLSILTFEKIINTTSNKTIKVSALTQIGDAYQDINELHKAITIYDRILKEYPDSMYTDYVQFRQGIALLKLNKIEAATLSFQTLQTNFPTSKYLNDVKYYLAVTYFKKKDWDLSRHYAQAYLKQRPQVSAFSIESHYILGLSYFNTQRFEKALNVFSEIIKEYPNDEKMTQVAELNVGKCLYHLNLHQKAIQQFQHVDQIYPFSEEAQQALLWLGDHFMKNAKWETAIAYYREFSEKFPGSNKGNIINFQLGQCYQAMAQYENALNVYKLISNHPDQLIYAKARLEIGEIFTIEFNPEVAIATYESIIKNAPDFTRDAYTKIADIYERNQEYEKAIETYGKAFQTDKASSEMNSSEIQFHIGDLYETINALDQALDSYFKVTYLYPNDTPWVIKSYLRIARIFEDTEQWQQAEIIYQKILLLETEESKYAQERIDWLKKNILK